MSSFYIMSYLGVALPALAMGFGAQAIGLVTMVMIFTGVISLLVAALLGTLKLGFVPNA